MSFRRPCRNQLFRVLALLLCLCGNVRAENVILHLRNGDRITGIIVSETTNQVGLSNAWTSQILVPQTQILSREIIPQTVPGPVVAPLVRTGTNEPGHHEHGTNHIAISIVPEPPKTNFVTWLKRWKGEAQVGMDMERGAVDHELYYAKAKLSYEQAYESDPKEFFRNIFNYDMAYGKTDGTLSDNRVGGSSKTDFDLNHNWYVYNLGAASRDQIRLIDLHYEDGPGLGYHWVNRTNIAVNVELGANYQVEYRSDNTSTESAYYRIGQTLNWKITKLASFTEKFEYSPRADSVMQGRMRFESNLSYALFLNLSLNLTLVDLYDTQPAATVPNNDFQLRTSLGLKF